MSIPCPRLSTTLLFRLAGAVGLLSGAVAGQTVSFETWIDGPNQPPSQTGRLHKVTGIVVNAATGAAVPKALVQGPTMTERVSVLTGPDGRFEIDGVPEGAVNLMPRKPGYFNEQELDQGPGFPRMIQVGENTPDVQLKLFPEGVIEGRVLDEAGEPVEGATLEALCSQVREGRRRWEQRSGGSTDDTGAFRLSNLQPGQYLVFVNAAGPQGRKAGQTFDLVFPPVYYPGGATPAEATTISISAGQHLQADFSLKRQPGFMVSGVVVNVPQAAGTGIYVRPAGVTNNMNMLLGTGAKPNGEFRLGPLPEGDYILTLQAQNGQTALWQEMPLTIGHADVTGLQLAPDPPYEIPIQLTVVRTKSAGQPGDNGAVYVADGPGGPVSARPVAHGVQLGNISFTSDDGSSQYVALHEQADQQNEPMAVKGLRPGIYHMNSGGNGAFYVESARSGDTDLLDAPLVIHPGTAPPAIQITLRDDGANLMLNCTKETKPQSCAVLLAPSHGRPIILYGFGSGGVSASGLAPGDYRIYAFDYAADLEYANPEAMRDYSSKGQGVSLEPNEQKTLTIEVIHRDAPGG
jgi:hypothetical protein